jgi:hypothetical protein
MAILTLLFYNFNNLCFEGPAGLVVKGTFVPKRNVNLFVIQTFKAPNYNILQTEIIRLNRRSSDNFWLN